MRHTRWTEYRLRHALGVCVVGLLVSAATAWAAAPVQEVDGEAIYREHCATCHATATRAPKFEVMRRLPAAFVLRSMELGKMRFQGMMRTGAERRAVSEYITGKTLPPVTEKDPTVAGFCSDAPGAFPAAHAAAAWNGWGVDETNSRFQPSEAAGLSAEQVATLKVKWVFGLPMDYQTSQPTVVGGRVFVGSLGGHVYSIDAKTGCLYWAKKPKAGVRASVVIGRLPDTDPPRYAAYFGDIEANMYAVDARTGEELWQTRVDDHRLARITGTPTLHDNRLYVPVTALEEVAGSDPSYECCTFRGPIVALDAGSGQQIWKAYTIPDEPKPVRKNAKGVQLWGPSGASVWSAPTLDLKKNVMYVATGDNYSDPPSLTSDALVAFDLETGEMLWSQQFTPNDAWNIGCESDDQTNCPEARGPDLDFGSSSILRELPDGRRILVAGQKSGVLHAVDPDNNGAILWQARLGKGGLAGGIQWGPAADASTVYVALSDIGLRTVEDSQAGWTTELDPSVGGGMFAYDLATGNRLWHVPPPGCGDRAQCSPAQSAAVSVIPGVVFSGSVDSHLRAYSTTDGTVLWDYNADQEYDSTNGVPTRGGAFDGPGPTIVDGVVYVNSGYGFWGARSGNALIAFAPGE